MNSESIKKDIAKSLDVYQHSVKWQHLKATHAWACAVHLLPDNLICPVSSPPLTLLPLSNQSKLDRLYQNWLESETAESDGEKKQITKQQMMANPLYLLSRLWNHNDQEYHWNYHLNSFFFALRQCFVANFICWSIPSPQALQHMVQTVNGSPIIDVGAGHAYWSMLLKLHGATEVISVDSLTDYQEESKELKIETNPHKLLATDFPDETQFETGETMTNPSQDQKNEKHEGNSFRPFLTFHPILQQDIVEYLKTNPSDHCALFFSWTRNDEVIESCLGHWRGKHIFVVGESDGGCTGSLDYYMKTHSHEWIAQTMNIPTWFGVRDFLTTYTRKELHQK